MCALRGIRLDTSLLPFLEQEFSPQIRRHLASLAETTREEEDWLEGLATSARRRITAQDNSLSLLTLNKEPSALRSRILRQWVEGQVQDLKTVHVLRLRELSEGKIQGTVQLPERKSVVREGTRLILQTQRPGVTRARLPLCLAGWAELALGLTLEPDCFYRPGMER